MKDLFKKTEKPVKGGILLHPLIQIRGHKCECCKLTEWLGQPINLQVHHIDGDKTNNELKNLQLLCLNCHSYTNNFGSKNNKHKNSISDEQFINALKNSQSIRQALFKLKLSDTGANYTRARRLCQKNNITFTIIKKNQENYCKRCGVPIYPSSTYCTDCNTFLSRIVERPNREDLKKLIRTQPFTKIAQQYNVSDKAIVKWCKRQNLPYRKKDIKLYSEEEWNKI